MEWLTFVLGMLATYLLLPLLQSVAGNLLTDPVKNWYAKRSNNSKRKRIDVLESELAEITRLHKDREYRYQDMFHNAFILIMFGALGAAFATSALLYSGILRQLLLFTAIILFGVLTRASFDAAVKVARIKRYDEYRERTGQRIASLSSALPPVISEKSRSNHL